MSTDTEQSLLCHLWFILSSARKLLSQRNSQKAKADRESVFKASQSAGKNVNVQRGKTADVGLTSFPMIPHLQSCPTDDLIYRPCKTGAGNQWLEGSGRRISAPRRLRWPGERGRALLQGSSWPRSAGGNSVGAWSVALVLFCVPVWEKELVLVSHQKAERWQTKCLPQEQKCFQLAMDHFQAHLSK